MTARGNFGHRVDMEHDQRCGIDRYRANCRDCAYISAWCTTAPAWPDAPQRPAHVAQERALSAARGHLRGRLSVIPTQGPVPTWERDRQPSAGKVDYSVTADRLA